jgi:hypothetical protein
MLAAAASVARRRRVAPGILITLGGSFVDHVQDVRADRAGAGLRDVAGTPSAPAALQNAKRFRRCHVQRVERAIGRAGPRLDEPLGRDPGEPVTIDLDATQVTVYGRRKQGTNRRIATLHGGRQAAAAAGRTRSHAERYRDRHAPDGRLQRDTAGGARGGRATTGGQRGAELKNEALGVSMRKHRRARSRSWAQQPDP